MPALLIKICGISEPAALEATIAARADFAGLVFYPPSPRHVSLDSAAALGAIAGGRIARVGLFVDADDATIAAAVAAGQLDAIQLHGEESPQRVGELRTRFSLPVWKALPIAARADLDRTVDYAAAADLVLLDARTPKGALPGGMGLTFDWSLLHGWRAPGPWGLAGGLTPGNVGEAVKSLHPPLVDTSSGVESAPGVKDVDKIAAFCKAARHL